MQLAMLPNKKVNPVVQGTIIKSRKSLIGPVKSCNTELKVNLIIIPFCLGETSICKGRMPLAFLNKLLLLFLELFLTFLDHHIVYMITQAIQ